VKSILRLALPALVFLIATSFASTSKPTINDLLDADYDALEEPLPPVAAPGTVAKLSAKFGYFWSQPDRTQVLVLLGGFRLTLPRQELTSRDAVIWLDMTEKDGLRIKKLQVFLSGDARVIEPSGAVTEDQTLFITIYTTAKVQISGEGLVNRDGSDQQIYQHAVAYIKEGRTPPAGTVKQEGIIVHPPGRTPRVEPRRPITIKGDFALGPRVDGRPVLIGTGGIYLIQAAEPGGEATELRATNAVLFLKAGATAPQALGLGDGASGKGKPRAPTASGPLTTQAVEKGLEKLPTEEEAAQQETPIEQARENEFVRAAYLEGDVVLTRGYRQIRADRVYYDFEQAKAVLLDVVASTLAPERNVPVYIRAHEARQLSEYRYLAKNAKVTTSEFYTPSYDVSTTTIYFEDRTERTKQGEQIGLAAGKFEAYNATLDVEGLPVLYWPYIRGDFKQSETAIRSASFSYDTEFGITGKTRWDLFPVLGLEKPEGTDGVLRLDYYGDRGPGAGVNLDYERDTYYGLVRSYYVHDTGEDRLGGIRDDLAPPYDNRGRALVRHRQYLPDKWELTLEASYLSDRNFLEEYFRSEYDEGKEQETLIYLKRPVGEDSVASILGKFRLNDFQNQVEYLPEGRYDVLGKPLLGGLVNWYSDNRLGGVRLRLDEDLPKWLLPARAARQTATVLRGDTRQEFEIPITLGPLKVAPFAVVRGTGWDDSYDDGGLCRFYGAYGVRGSMYQWKVYDDVESRMLDLHRLRHIMKEDFTVWGAHSSRGPDELTAYDRDVELIDGADGFTFGWQHILQTKRGGPGQWRTVDWLTVDLEAGFFNDATDGPFRNQTRGQTFGFRPETSIASNYLSMKSIWRISDTTALLYDTIWDSDDWALGSSGLGLHIDRDPRLSWFVGHRYIGQTHSNLAVFGANYRLNSKYTLAVREAFDMDRGRNAELELTLIRRLPRWYLAVTFQIDDTEGVDSISVAVWPEGIPEWTLGSRRYTGLATSTGIRP